MPILNWLNKEQAVTAARNCSYRLLEQVPELSYGEKDTENMLIQGDNLEALKALIPTHTGRIKCIFIDPPYNTKSAFEHYDDNLEHSKWLSMIYPRLELLHQLLTEDGSIWITLDDNESHYFKVMMDEVFGRKNFIANAIWEKSDSPRMDAQFYSVRHDHVLCYAKNINLTKWNRLLTEVPKHYDKIDLKGRKYYLKPLRAMGGQGDTRIARPTLYYALEAPDGSLIYPRKQDGTDGAWRWKKEKVEKENDRIDWIDGRNGWTANYRIYAEKNPTRPVETIWTHDDVGSNRKSKAEVKALFPDITPFGTPKPEALIQRIIHIASDQGDLVLDSFLGSATTAAVAHKMNRKFIGIELGEHAITHCQPRLQKVVDGEQGGISKDTSWQGGGGFKFYRLGEVIFNENGSLKNGISFDALSTHIWYGDTRRSLEHKEKSPLLGVHNGIAYYLLYNGILGDKRPDGGNVLTSKVLAILPAHPLDAKNGKKVIYGETSRMGQARLKSENIIFKQIPYDVRGR